MDVKKLGRIVGCCGDCSILNRGNAYTRSDFERIFQFSGDYRFATPEEGARCQPCFQNRCDLELVDERTLFGKDNYALRLNPHVYLNTIETNILPEVTIQEQYEFLIGEHKIVGTFKSVVQNEKLIEGRYYEDDLSNNQENPVVEIKFDEKVVYTSRCNVLFPTIGNAGFLAGTDLRKYYYVWLYGWGQVVHYIIRRNGWVYYYLCALYDNVDRLIYIGKWYEGESNVESPVRFKYHWSCSSPRAVLFFGDAQNIDWVNPDETYWGNADYYYTGRTDGEDCGGFIDVWKPDKWWLLTPWQPYKSMAELYHDATDDNMLEFLKQQYTQFYRDKEEAEHCSCPMASDFIFRGFVRDIGMTDHHEDPRHLGSRYSQYRRQLLDTGRFQALSEKLAIQMHGFKKSSNGTPGALGWQAHIWRYSDPNDPNTPLVLDKDLVTEDIPGLKEAIDNNEMDVSKYINDYINSLPDGTSYVIQWFNGSGIRYDYSNLEKFKLNAVYGENNLYFQKIPAVSVMFDSAPDYSGTDKYGNKNYNFGCYQKSKVLHDDWANGVVKWEVGEYNMGDNPEAKWILNHDTIDYIELTSAELSLRTGIIAPYLYGRIGYGKTYQCNIPEDYAGVGGVVQDESWNEVWLSVNLSTIMTDIEISISPKYGQVEIKKDYYPYKIIYTAPEYKTDGRNNPKHDFFEYALTDRFGAKSRAVVTICLDKNGSNQETTIQSDSSMGSELPDDRLDYDIICRVTLKFSNSLLQATSDAGCQLFYVHDGTMLSVEQLYGKTATYMKQLDKKDGNDDPIRQLKSADGQEQDEISVTFSAPDEAGDCLTHDVFNIMIDESAEGTLKNIEYIEAECDIYYNFIGIDYPTYNYITDINYLGSKTLILKPATPLACNCPTDTAGHPGDGTFFNTGRIEYEYKNHWNEDQVVDIGFYIDPYIRCYRYTSHDPENPESGLHRYIKSLTIHYEGGETKNIPACEDE